MTNSWAGFFVVPFWNANGCSVKLSIDFKLTVPPCDGAKPVAVLAVNLLKPLKEVKAKAVAAMRAWLS